MLFTTILYKTSMHVWIDLARYFSAVARKILLGVGIYQLRHIGWTDVQNKPVGHYSFQDELCKYPCSRGTCNHPSSSSKLDAVVSPSSAVIACSNNSDAHGSPRMKLHDVTHEGQFA